MNSAAAKVLQVAQQEKDMRVKSEEIEETKTETPEEKTEEPVKDEEPTA